MERIDSFCFCRCFAQTPSQGSCFFPDSPVPHGAFNTPVSGSWQRLVSEHLVVLVLRQFQWVGRDLEKKNLGRIRDGVVAAASWSAPSHGALWRESCSEIDQFALRSAFCTLYKAVCETALLQLAEVYLLMELRCLLNCRRTKTRPPTPCVHMPGTTMSPQSSCSTNGL